MMRSIRWKVLVALLLSVAIPLGASIYFFRKGVVRAYSVAMNRDVERGLQVSIDAQREIMNLWKRLFRARGAAHAADCRLHDALLAGDYEEAGRVLGEQGADEESLVESAVVDEEGAVLAAAAKDPARYPEEEWRRLTVTSPLPLLPGGASAILEEQYAAPWHIFRLFDETGKTFQTYQASLRAKEDITGLYVKVYLMLVGLSVLVALVISFLHLRGLGLRIMRIAAAARLVGKGNLDIEVADGSRDEVGDLGRNFDLMVRELRENRERIDYLQKISGWQEIARRLAHEIKNPLTPIKLSVQQIRSTYRGDDPAYRATLETSVQIIEEEIEALGRLVAEFSGFARLPGVTPLPCSLNETLVELLAGSEASCREKGVALETNLVGDRLPVALDRIMFKRALDNLVANAVQAVERARDKRPGAGGGTVLVESGVAGRRGEAFIAISDSGDGVAPEDREKIFLPYFTRRTEGTGLGLPIVKKIILEHGGNVELKEGRHPALGGAVFRITLPLHPDTG